mmetsp:Transcript_131903/g.367736  ORF Transcript_131903/g.367736 Transcript_131903/m.367736 type:complete len:271 (-) Transcript_131903:1780-2592(-)
MHEGVEPCKLALRKLEDVLTCSPEALQLADGAAVVHVVEATDLCEEPKRVLGDGVLDEPRAAVVPARFDWKPRIFRHVLLSGVRVAERQADVRVEHHLQGCPLQDATGPTLEPLVLLLVAAHRLHRPPALLRHGNVIVVVEFPAVDGIAPPAVVPRVLRPGAAQGVHAHQCRRVSEGQLHVLHEGLSHGIAAVLRVREQRGRARTGRCCLPPEAEVCLEVGRRSLRIIAQDVLPRFCHDGLRRNDDEVGEGHGGAELFVDALQRLAVLAG